MNKTLSAYLTLFLILAGVFSWYFWPEHSLDADFKIDYILIEKSKREMTVYSKNVPLKTYKIALGRIPAGKKQFEGDMKTPEGIYAINDKNPKSSYHLNLGISYPNASDIAYARTHHRSPGGQIKIHGLRNGLGFIGKFHRLRDWTLGCIAVTNNEVEELYEHVPIGTKIEIVP